MLEVGPVPAIAMSVRSSVLVLVLLLLGRGGEERLAAALRALVVLLEDVVVNDRSSGYDMWVRFYLIRVSL